MKYVWLRTSSEVISLIFATLITDLEQVGKSSDCSETKMEMSGSCHSLCFETPFPSHPKASNGHNTTVLANVELQVQWN